MYIGSARLSYRADEAIWQRPAHRGSVAALLLALLLLPLFGNDYTLLLAGQLCIYVIAITGLNLLTGYTGLISLGQGAFMGVGAYATAVLASRYGLPIWITFPGAMAITALAGIAVGLPSLRVRGLYLTIATLAANVIIIFIIRKMEWLTGGDRGISVTPASIFGVPIQTEFAKYLLIMPIAAIFVLFAQNLFRTKVGRAFIAIREQDYSAEILGISLLRYKLTAFALGSAYAGAAGCLWTYFFTALTPNQFDLGLSILFLAALIVGGMGTVLGPVFGAVFVVLVPEVLRSLASLATPYYPMALQATAPLTEIIYGLLIIGFLIFEPMGLTALWNRLWRYIDRWPFTR
ncbi:MAG: branched-chain amino acid ABC transporter permease [Arenicellales bacterium]|nr:branched-chain amino acid ABC transporter permease [Arenicellales bacterium]